MNGTTVSIDLTATEIPPEKAVSWFDRAQSNTRPSLSGGLAIAISLAVMVAALWELRGLDLSRILALVPASPLFWAAFAAFYLSGPTAELVIYRRLWKVPPGAMLALLRKQLCNELLLGYSGEVYFYSWARRNVAIEASPFGAVKDVTILSAMVGNVITLVLLGASARYVMPLINGLQVGADGRAILLSLAVVAVSSLAIFVFRRRLFTLPRSDLAFVTMVHTARVCGMIVLTALLWHLALPHIGLGWWLALVTLRQLVSRLPFVPNKDIVFTGLAVFFVGEVAGIASVIAMLAGLMLLTHLVIAAAIFCIGLVQGDVAGDTP
ncbi:hypothetical protein [Flavisphingopyxis soli]|uniref:hypothetical protein n=1 Tax=Flavisphingopyxis soli TaxID=2601267 RepID=UPI001F1AD6A3|nr:hypothetical protein [Sphingorhabdus soli]